VIVESTSGNLGVALAFISRAKGYRFLAVVDPKAPRETLERMRCLGAEIEMVSTPDTSGGYLLTRLGRVGELCASAPSYLWPDQYSNAANPSIHFRTTGPEILSQMNGVVDAVFVAVSTGGTLAGIGSYFKQASPKTRVIGVDAVGSVAFAGSPAPRKLNGIGSSRRSQFLTPDLYDMYLMVHDLEAFCFCRYLREKTHLLLGGSSGAVMAACARYLAAHSEIKRSVCLCADAGTNYISSIFDDDWMIQNGITLPSKPPEVEDAW
jgi:cysteine synthase